MTQNLLTPDIKVERTSAFLQTSADFRTNAVLLVCGSREFTDRKRFNEILSQWISKHGRPRKIIAGECRGVDQMAKEEAIARGVEYEGFPAEWNKMPKNRRRAAGPIRNAKMVDVCTHVLALVSRSSVGTLDTIEKARNQLKPVTPVRID